MLQARTEINVTNSQLCIKSSNNSIVWKQKNFVNKNKILNIKSVKVKNINKIV